jgi:hypothetical protein
MVCDIGKKRHWGTTLHMATDELQEFGIVTNFKGEAFYGTE